MSKARLDGNLEQPGLAESAPAHGREVGIRWSLWSLPTQTILSFYDSIILSFICLNPKVKILWNLDILVKSESTDMVCTQAKARKSCACEDCFRASGLSTQKNWRAKDSVGFLRPTVREQTKEQSGLAASMNCLHYPWLVPSAMRCHFSDFWKESFDV